MDINAEHFDRHSFFGEEQRIDLGNSHAQAISKNKLLQRIDFTIRSVDPEKQDALRHSLNSEFLASVLGEHERYDIQASVQKVRLHQPTTPASMLLDRCLTLLSLDGLDPVCVSKLDLNDVYAGLHITEESILPDIRKSNATRLLSVRLYKDPSCRVRLHIMPEAPEGVIQDNYIHEHSAHCASIVLAGNLVNQHYNVTPSSASPFHAYKVTPDVPRNAQGIRGGDSYDRVGPVDITRVSSHAYQAGDHYMLPGKAAKGYSFHKIGSKGLTATLFFEQYPDVAWDTHSIRTSNYPDHYYKGVEEGAVATADALQTIQDADKEIRQSLAAIERPRTLLERSKGSVNSIVYDVHSAAKRSGIEVA